MKSSFKLSGRWLTILVALALLATGVAFFRARGKQRVEYVTSAAGIGTIRSTVTATGAVEAVRTVQVGTQVFGAIASLHADFNSIVRKGQVIAQIDASIYQAQAAQVRANLDAARAQLADAIARLTNAQANIETQSAGRAGADANLASLKAQRDEARQLLTRHETLAEDSIITARAAREYAEQQLAGEERKFAAGLSTTFLVLTRQTDLSQSRGTELRAMTDYNKAVADLQKAVSTTLSSNDIQIKPR